MQYAASMGSEVYGGEIFSPYESLNEAHEAVHRIQSKAESLNDKIERTYSIGFLGKDGEYVEIMEID